MYTLFHGEVLNNIPVDSILRNYFPDYSYKGVFIDVGSFEPIRISNSYHFEQNGWTVYCLEANTNQIELLQKYRKNVLNYAVYDEDKDNIEFNVVTSSGWTAGFSAIELDNDISNAFPCSNKTINKIVVNQRKLDTLLLNEMNQISKIDILKIDVEGGELKVLKGLNFNKFKPTVICLENICRKKDIQDFLYINGYRLDKQIEYNQFYTLI